LASPTPEEQPPSIIARIRSDSIAAGVISGLFVVIFIYLFQNYILFGMIWFLNHIVVCFYSHIVDLAYARAATDPLRWLIYIVFLSGFGVIFAFGIGPILSMISGNYQVSIVTGADCRAEEVALRARA